MGSACGLHDFLLCIGRMTQGAVSSSLGVVLVTSANDLTHSRTNFPFTKVSTVILVSIKQIIKLVSWRTMQTALVVFYISESIAFVDGKA